MPRACPPRLLVLLASALILALPTHAEIVEATGVASLDAGQEAARPLAIEDALTAAARVHGTRFQGHGELDRGHALESGRLASASRARLIEVVEEREIDGLLHVRVRAETSGTHDNACERTGSAPRKRIAASFATLADPLHVQDLRDLGEGLPRALLTHLNRDGDFLIANEHPIPALPAPSSPERIAALADQIDSQFIIETRLLDAGVGDRNQSRVTFVSGESGYHDLSLELPFLPRLGFKREPASRRLELSLAIHDGLTGATVARHILTEDVSGRVWVGLDKPFGGRAFLDTATGQAFDRLLARAADLTRQELSCLPFSARIVDIDGDTAYIDAGTLARIKPGDTFIVYRRGGKPVQSLRGGRLLGTMETPVATATVTQAQPLFAVTTLTGAGDRPARAGDLVRLR